MGPRWVTRDEAAYWGGGVLAETPTGWVSLHVRATPAGIETWHADRDGRHDGWPSDTYIRYVYASPDDGGSACICSG